VREKTGLNALSYLKQNCTPRTQKLTENCADHHRVSKCRKVAILRPKIEEADKREGHVDDGEQHHEVENVDHRR
jgi:hypothetical protein